VFGVQSQIGPGLLLTLIGALLRPVLGRWIGPRLDRWEAALQLKRVSLYFDPTDKRCEVYDAAHHVYRVGVVNKTGKPLHPVWLRIIKTWPQDAANLPRPLQEKDDVVDGNLEFPASKAGVLVNPTSDAPSRFFNVVEKFYQDIPDPRFTGEHRHKDHVYVSVASGVDRHSPIVIPDGNIRGLHLRLDTPFGPVEQDFGVKVVGGRLIFKRA